MLPIIKTHNNIIFFTGDLIPAKASIPLAWISAYDLFPLTSVEEKKNILNEAVENNWILLFQHDYYNIASRVTKTEKGVRGAENLISLELMKL